MEIKSITLSNIEIRSMAPPCTSPVIPTVDFTFVSGLQFYSTFTVYNATSATLSGLPTGITANTTQAGTDLIVTLSGTPNTTGQSFTMNVTATSSGVYCLANTQTATIETGTVAGVTTTNLRQYIDIANGVSYPGWGNTVYDLTANTLDYYLINGPAFFSRANVTVDTTNGGSMVFDGANIGRIFATTWDGVNSNPIANTGDANWTLETWFKLRALPNANTKLTLIGEKWGGILNSDVHHMLTFENPLGSPVSGNALAGGSFSIGYYVTPNYAIYPGQYYHAAVSCANGNVRRLYINGTEVANLVSGSITAASDLETRIGADLSVDAPTAEGILNGSVAIARYYSNTLTAAQVSQNYNAEVGRFIGGSLSFNGANSVLSAGSNADWASNTGDYTLQFWANTVAAGNVTTPLPVWDSTALKVFFEANTSNASLKYLTVVSANTRVASTPPITWDGSWKNFAVSRTSNVLRIFADGVMQTVVSDTSNANAVASLFIGNATVTTSMTFNNTAANGSYYFNGGLTNIQWVKGQSLYTSNAGFTPSMLPIPPTLNSNVRVLLKVTDGNVSITDSSPRATVFTSANVTFSTASPFANSNTTSALQMVRFDYTGNWQTWTVPTGVTSIRVTATGAKGGSFPGQLTGGNGACATTVLSVTPGQTLSIAVGGTTSNATGGWPGGGNAGTGTLESGFGGGGLSGVFASNALSNAGVLFAVGGGGGAGAGSRPYNNGGDAGGSPSGIGSNGFGWGGLFSSGNPTNPGGRGGGTAGVDLAGAAGVNNGYSTTVPTSGNLFTGGRGGSSFIADTFGGGGGGGGYRGGGGATAGLNTGSNESATPRGGGGGSTWSSNNSSLVYFNGMPFASTNGVVIINYSI